MDQELYNPRRKVTTIMITDIVAYGRLMGENEKLTLNNLNLRRLAFEHLVNAFGGRVFGSETTRFMAEFPDTANSLRCAINLQEAIRELNLELAEKLRMRLRIGLNLGDVTQQGSDLFGEGVDIAGRVGLLSDPGGICLANNVHEQVHRQLDLQYQLLGPQDIKDFDTPITTFKVLGHTAATSSEWHEFIRVFKINLGFRYQLLFILLLGLIAANKLSALINQSPFDYLIQITVIAIAAALGFYFYKKNRPPVTNKGPRIIIDSNLLESTLSLIRSKSFEKKIKKRYKS